MRALGRRCGKTNDARLNKPTVTPELPTPCVARPTIKVVGLLATAQMMLPTSNMRISIKYQSSIGRCLKSSPQVDCKPPKVTKYAAPYHETLFKS